VVAAAEDLINARRDKGQLASAGLDSLCGMAGIDSVWRVRLVKNKSCLAVKVSPPVYSPSMEREGLWATFLASGRDPR